MGSTVVRSRGAAAGEDEEGDEEKVEPGAEGDEDCVEKAGCEDVRIELGEGPLGGRLAFVGRELNGRRFMPNGLLGEERKESGRTKPSGLFWQSAISCYSTVIYRNSALLRSSWWRSEGLRRED